MLTKNGIRTLVDVVIVDPTQMDLFPWFYTIIGFDAFDVAQAKERSYYDRHPIDKFLLLVIKIFIYINMLTCFYMIVPMPFEAWNN